jgi:hypothetical protein
MRDDHTLDTFCAGADTGARVPAYAERDLRTHVAASDVAPVTLSEHTRTIRVFEGLVRLGARELPELTVSRWGREFTLTPGESDPETEPFRAEHAGIVGYGSSVREAIDDCDDTLRICRAHEFGLGTNDVVHPKGCMCPPCASIARTLQRVRELVAAHGTKSLVRRAAEGEV